MQKAISPVTCSKVGRPKHVKLWSCLSLLVLGVASAWSAVAPQNPQGPLPNRRPVRIPIRHADPWVVKMMVEGQPVVMPEMSTIFGLFGAPPQAGGQMNGLFSGGHFLVNPTDNSLWWYPD